MEGAALSRSRHAGVRSRDAVRTRSPETRVEIGAQEDTTMRHRLVITLVTLALAWTASVARAADSCVGGCPKPPKKSRHVSTPAPVPMPAAPAAILVAGAPTFAKGQKKRVIAVDATITSSALAPGAPMVIGMGATVNGAPMEPTAVPFPTQYVADCGGTALFPPQPPHFACTLHGTFWLDIDTAEAASPGTFVNMPLTVSLTAFDLAGFGGAPVIAAMVIRQEQK
jgi:hypothetical protein